jgi:hypothetical protein
VQENLRSESLSNELQDATERVAKPYLGWYAGGLIPSWQILTIGTWVTLALWIPLERSIGGSATALLYAAFAGAFLVATGAALAFRGPKIRRSVRDEVASSLVWFSNLVGEDAAAALAQDSTSPRTLKWAIEYWQTIADRANVGGDVLRDALRLAVADNNIELSGMIIDTWRLKSDPGDRDNQAATGPALAEMVRSGSASKNSYHKALKRTITLEYASPQ